MYAFFQRPGVTPARVAPWLALAVLIPAFVIGANLEPLGQQRAAYEEPPIVIAGGGTQTPLPGGVGTASGAVAGVSANGDDASGGDAFGGGDDAGTGDAAAADDGSTFAEPVPEPAFSEPAFSEPAGGDTTTGDDLPAEGTPAGEATESYEGTVVRVNKRSTSYAIATGEQDLIAIHARQLPKPGDSVRADARPLANGTYEEVGEREQIDTATSAAFRGWVTWVAPEGLAYTVSHRGASLLVRRADAADPVPLGAPVAVAADIDPDSGGLTQITLTAEGERTDSPVHVAGTVRAVDREQRTIALTADDLGESGAELTIAVPDEEIDLGKIEPRDVVDATVVIGADASYTLTGVSSNENAKAADDTEQAQGDQVEQEDPDATGKSADRLLRSLGIAPAG